MAIIIILVAIACFIFGWRCYESGQLWIVHKGDWDIFGVASLIAGIAEVLGGIILMVFGTMLLLLVIFFQVF